MITYLYNCSEKHGEFEHSHKISEKLEFCPQCEEEGKQTPVTRLISKGTGFLLQGGGWARDNYSK